MIILCISHIYHIFYSNNKTKAFISIFLTSSEMIFDRTKVDNVRQ